VKRSTDRILTTFGGSLIRPPEVLAFTPEVDEPTRTATLRTAVTEVVRKQAELRGCGLCAAYTYVLSEIGWRARTSHARSVGVSASPH
jgi:hypothetical protein